MLVNLSGGKWPAPLFRDDMSVNYFRRAEQWASYPAASPIDRMDTTTTAQYIDGLVAPPTDPVLRSDGRRETRLAFDCLPSGGGELGTGDAHYRAAIHHSAAIVRPEVLGP